MAGEPCSATGGGAEQNLSPARDGCKGGGSLHGVANEAQVLENFRGGPRRRRRDAIVFGRTVEAPDAMRPRVKHLDIVIVRPAAVKYSVPQR